MRRAVLIAMALATFGAAAPADAKVVNFKAHMTGSAEVPPNKSGGSGDLLATYDTISRAFHWKGTFSGLSGPATAAHFHGPASVGKNAGVAIPIFSGAKTAGPFEGTATLTEAQSFDLLGGDWYVNVHTEAFKAGEIRGQVVEGK